MGPVKAPICAIFFSSATFFRCRCIRFDWHFSFLARKKTSTPGHRTDVVPRSGSLLLHELGPLLGFSTTLGLSDCRFLLLKKARISADDLFPHTVHCPTFLSQTDQSLTEKKPAAFGNVEVCRTTEVRHPSVAFDTRERRIHLIDDSVVWSALSGRHFSHVDACNAPPSSAHHLIKKHITLFY